MRIFLRKVSDMLEKKKSVKKIVMNYVLITLSCFVYAVAISLFLDPNNLAPGGITGIAIILNRVIAINTGLLIFIINIPILLLGMWRFGFRFIISTVYCTLLISFFTGTLSNVGAVTADPLLASLAGAVLMAVGLGGIFKAGTTSGGTDIIIKILRQHFPHLKTGFLFLLTDVMIVTASAFVFRNIDRALYAGITVFITSYVLDLVLYGRDEAKLIFIISDESEKITRRLLDDLDIGVTFIEGQGAYSRKDKRVIMCVMRKQIAPLAEEIVKNEDSRAFMIVASATEIFGEGYKSYFGDKL